MDLPIAFLERSSVKKCLSSSCVWKGRYQEGAWLVVTVADKSLDSQERNRDMEGNTPGLWRFTKMWKHQMELGSKKTDYKKPLSKSLSFYYPQMGRTRKEDVTFPSNESRAWRKALLKPTRRGRNTKIPSSAPQTASRRSVPRSNAFSAIQWSRRNTQEHAQRSPSEALPSHSARPRAFHNHLKYILEAATHHNGKTLPTGKSKNPNSVFTYQPVAQASLHQRLFYHNGAIPLSLIISSVHVTHNNSFIYFQN